MKSMVLIGFIAAAISLSSEAQVTGERAAKTKRSTFAKKTTIKKNRSPLKEGSSATTYSMVSSSSNAAKSSSSHLTIADPVILDLNQRARNLDNQPAGFGIPGMPKRMYGFAMGHLFLRSTDAPGTGTTTGSGSVGTGTSLGSVGSAGNTLTVNGKNPYAGAEIYGIPGFAPTNPPASTNTIKKQ
ncbi:MAG: hypothetical protein ACM3VS_02135 [Candidatus Dadabacteria bacterium]